MKCPAVAALTARFALKFKSYESQVKGGVALYCEDVSYLLETDETDDVIAETDTYMMQFA